MKLKQQLCQMETKLEATQLIINKQMLLENLAVLFYVRAFLSIVTFGIYFIFNCFIISCVILVIDIFPVIIWACAQYCQWTLQLLQYFQESFKINEKE